MSKVLRKVTSNAIKNGVRVGSVWVGSVVIIDYDGDTNTTRSCDRKYRYSDGKAININGISIGKNQIIYDSYEGNSIVGNNVGNTVGNNVAGSINISGDKL